MEKKKPNKKRSRWGRLPSVQVGAAPGALRVDPDAPHPRIRVIAYSPDEVVEKEVASPNEVGEFLGKWPVTWVNVDGLGDADTITTLGEIFKLHRLAVEDVINVPQRAKVDTFSDHCFIVTRMVTMEKRLRAEQLSMVVGDGFVVSFQERAGDCLDPIRERIRTGGGGRIRKAGPDYLAYAILDAVANAFYPLLEDYGERLEELETQVVSHPKRDAIGKIHRVRRELLTLRRAIWPQREMFNSLIRDDVPHISDETRLYFRDCYDHVVQVIDMTETFRELAGGLLEAYMSGVSHRMNDVMKVLTIIATIFIPLSFIAGLYGMNFDSAESPLNMPELHWYFGYPFALTLMALIAAAMLWLFWRKGWLGQSAAMDDEDAEDE